MNIKISIIGVLLLALFSMTCHAAFLGLESEAIDLAPLGIGFSPGDYSYRIYAAFDDPSDGLLAVFDDPGNPVFISCAPHLLFQHPFGSDTAPMALLVGPFPDVEYDTFVSIGAHLDPDIDSGSDATGMAPGWPGFMPDGLFLAGTSNGWFVTPFIPQGIAGTFPDLRVLIGQFTVLGGTGDICADLTGNINIAIDVGGQIQLNSIWITCSTPTPLPTATPTATPTPAPPTATPTVIPTITTCEGMIEYLGGPALIGDLVNSGLTTQSVGYFYFTVGTAGTVAIDLQSFERFDENTLLPVDVNLDGEYAYIDPKVHLFIDDGDLTVDDLISTNDDSATFNMYDSSVHHFDSYMVVTLATGDYVLAVSGFNFDPTDAVAGFNVSGYYPATIYDDGIQNPPHYVHDHGDYLVTLVGDLLLTCPPTPTPTVTPTPEPTHTPAPIPTTGPAGLGLMLIFISGLLGLSALRKRK